MRLFQQCASPQKIFRRRITAADGRISEVNAVIAETVVETAATGEATVVETGAEIAVEIAVEIAAEISWNSCRL